MCLLNNDDSLEGAEAWCCSCMVFSVDLATRAELMNSPGAKAMHVT